MDMQGFIVRIMLIKLYLNSLKILKRKYLTELCLLFDAKNILH